MNLIGCRIKSKVLVGPDRKSSSLDGGSGYCLDSFRDGCLWRWELKQNFIDNEDIFTCIVLMKCYHITFKTSLYYCILNFWAKLLRDYFSLPIRLFTLALRLLWFPLLTLVNNLITNMWIYALPEFALRKKKLGKRPRHWNLQYAKYKV